MTSKVAGNIPHLDFEKLVTLWHNSLLYNNSLQGKKMRDAVEQEWKTREVDLHENSNGFVPENGLLSTLGYHVGSTCGVKPKLRRAILERVYKADLPIVYSHSYMAQWGKPQSARRRYKISNTFIGFIESKCGQSSFKKAIREWSDDLEFLQENIF
jgi:hypothetical protein